MTDEMNTKMNEKTQPAQQEEKVKTPPMNAQEEWIETGKTALIAIILAILIRTFFYEPFNIPSSSMKPTLDVGDFLFVSKPAYGYSRYSFPFGLAPLEDRVWDKEPTRGDVIVFWNDKTGQNYIKRLIGMPGDTVQVRNGRLHLNGTRVPRERLEDRKVYEGPARGYIKMREYTETLPNGTQYSIYEEGDYRQLDNTQTYKVPVGHYFMMGDNRDNSQDSRVSQMVGFVPYENIVGRADFIFYSTNGSAKLHEFWKWPQTIRYNRLFQSIDPQRPDVKEE